MPIEGTRSMPVPQRYAGRRHPAVNGGRPIVADTLLLHWSAGAHELEALHAFFMSRAKQASYNLAIDRNGAAGTMVEPQDAAWHAGDGKFPFAEDLEAGFVKLKGAKLPPDRHINLRSFAVCFCNRGFLDPSKAIKVRAAGREVVQARHRNPASRSTMWEGYTDAQIERFAIVVPKILEACPKIRFVTAHEDVTNRWVAGRGFAPTGGSKTDVGPAWPWHLFPWAAWGLIPVRFDYDAVGWRCFPAAGAPLNGPGTLPRTVDPGP
jgi:N-acetyl-anhydromuramyl-L-alanine amidase AmpD